MNTLIRGFLVIAVFAMGSSAAWADDYSDTVALFKNAGQSASFFSNSYGYAVFPNIAKGGLGVGAAHGKGQVYVGGKHVGNTSMTQVSVGLQAGGQAFSEIIFFEDQKTFEEFSSGNFEFSADAGAVVITASASGSASTTGTREPQAPARRMRTPSASTARGRRYLPSPRAASCMKQPLPDRNSSMKRWASSGSRAGG